MKIKRFTYFWIAILLLVVCYHKSQTLEVYSTLDNTYLEKVNMKKENPSIPEDAKSIFDFTVVDINDSTILMSKYTGFVTYIVNVASE